MRISDWSSDVCSSDLLTRCLSVGAHPVPFCGSAPCAFLWERTLCFSVGAHPVLFCGSAPCAFLWELTLCLSVGAHPVRDSTLNINAQSGTPHRAPAGGVHRFRELAPGTRTASRSGHRTAIRAEDRRVGQE